MHEGDQIADGWKSETRPPSSSGRVRVFRSSAHDIARLAARHIRLVLMVAFLVAGLTTLMVYVLPLKYVATGVVLIERGKSPTLRSDPLDHQEQMTDVINSEIGIVKSRTVAEGVIDRLGLADGSAGSSGMSVFHRLKGVLDDLGLTTRLAPREVMIREIDSRLKVEQPVLSSLLVVQFGAEDPEFAATVARAVIDVYLERHREIFKDNTAEFFEARVKETEAKLNELRDAIRRATESSEIEGLTLQRDAIQRTYMFYRERWDRAHADRAGDESLVNVRLVDYPAVPMRPKTSRLRRILMGLAAGLVFGVGLAFVREYLDHTVHTPGDITDHLDVPVLGSVRDVPARVLR